MEKKVVSNLTEITRIFAAFPCVLVTSSFDEKDNIIAIGMVHFFSFNPPLIGIGVAPKRYSYSLISKQREFVINIPNKEMVEKVNLCGEKSGREIDKFNACAFTKEKSIKVRVPSIKECPVSLECKVIKEVETGDHIWLIGEIVCCRIASDYKKEENLLYWGGKYFSLGEVIKVRY